MELVRSPKSAHAFGERNEEPENSGGKAVKDERAGGHPSARSAADEDGEEASPLAWPDP